MGRVSVGCAVAAAMAIALVAAPSASAQETLAASCAESPGREVQVTASGNTPGIAQTFTPSLSGTLTRVEITIREQTDALGDYLVQIRTIDTNGVPAQIVASATVPDADVPIGTTVVNVVFSNPTAVATGQSYSIALIRPTSVIWAGTPDCPPPGIAWYSTDGGVTWTQINDFDLAFRAFVTPPTSLTPPTPVSATCGGNQATIVGTPGNDDLAGTDQADVIATLGGNDEISGLAGEDVICGGSGRDTLRGGRGKDKLYGQGDKDKFAGGDGKDRCVGGKKDDTAKKCEVEKSV